MEEGEGSNSRKWENLPMDCLANVFERLGLEDLSVGVPMVCKSWHRASLSPHLWGNVNLHNMDLRVHDSPFVARFMAEYRLEAFSFSGFLKFTINRGRRSTWKVVFPTEGVSIGDWTLVSEECPKLNIIGLPDSMEEEDEKRLPDFICKWKELGWLCMQFIPISFKEILTEINHHCKGFFGLLTRGWITPEEASWITMFLPKIKQLYLRGSFMTKDCLMMIMEGCRELTVLDVRDCLGLIIDDEVLKKASSIETFEHGIYLLGPEDSDEDDDKERAIHVRILLVGEDY